MNAGRELDALVAEKVMDDVAVYGGEAVYLRGYQEKRLDGARERPNGGWKDPLPYSTDIAAAWQVVEHMQANRWDWELTPDGDRRWCLFQLGDPDDGGQVVSITADTTPLAICLVALKAVGVEVPE